MAPTTVLGIGIPASVVPPAVREKLQKALDIMESDMNASPYDWDMLLIQPDGDFDIILKKLREKQWDVVMVGMGLRTGLVPLFEKIVNAVHVELPNTKFAFNTEIEHTQDAVRRVSPLE